MKKSSMVLILSAWAIFLFAPIAEAQIPTDPSRRTIKVVTSFYPMYVMALNVLKDVPGVTLTNLTPPMTGCLHDYTATTNDMKKLADAEIFVSNGAGMESFLDRIIAQYPKITVLNLSKGIPLIMGNGGAENPHVWVSVLNAITQVKNLGLDMQKADPSHAELYRKNTEVYVIKLENLRQKMHAALAPYKAKKIITFHEAFPYFAQEFDLNIAAVVEREPGSEPSARELAQTIDLIRSSGIKVIFSEPQYPALAAQTIAVETGSTVYTLDPSVSGPDDPDAYVNIMEMNLEVLKNAFSK